jgi:hypothetical protein
MNARAEEKRMLGIHKHSWEYNITCGKFLD